MPCYPRAARLCDGQRNPLQEHLTDSSSAYSNTSRDTSFTIGVGRSPTSRLKLWCSKTQSINWCVWVVWPTKAPSGRRRRMQSGRPHFRPEDVRNTIGLSRQSKSGGLRGHACQLCPPLLMIRVLVDASVLILMLTVLRGRRNGEHDIVIQTTMMKRADGGSGASCRGGPAPRPRSGPATIGRREAASLRRPRSPRAMGRAACVTRPAPAKHVVGGARVLREGMGSHRHGERSTVAHELRVDACETRCEV